MINIGFTKQLAVKDDSTRTMARTLAEINNFKKILKSQGPSSCCKNIDLAVINCQKEVRLQISFYSVGQPELRAVTVS